MSNKVNLLGLNHQDLSDYFVSLGEKPFRASQVLKWIHQYAITDFDEMTNLSKALRQRLKDEAVIAAPQIVTEQRSMDGTRKWLLQVDDNNYIEMVLIPEDDRATLCISSQVGCALECTFCSTAQQGFNRNLTSAEIIGQLWLAEHMLRAEGYVTEEHGRAISNVVLMGMGEPLANFNQVVKAIDLMQSDFCYGLSWRRVTLSTAGIVPALLRLKEQHPVSLAISLHATTDELRNQLVPINKKYPLAELLKACHEYARSDKRLKITFEYVMLRGINDTPTHARQLVKLLKGLPAKINLIPFNPFPGSIYQCSKPQVIETFRDILLQADVMTITRKTRGNDIDAACGQLVGKVKDRTRRNITIPIVQEVA